MDNENKKTQTETANTPTENEKTETAVACRHCGAEQPADACFCMKCGAKMERGKICPVCRKEAAPSAVFCVSCGQSLSASAAPAAPTAPAASAYPIPAAPTAPTYSAYPPAPTAPAYPAVPRPAPGLSLKQAMRLARVWCAAALCAAMFGLSFLPFLSFQADLSVLSGREAVRVSPVQAIAALGYTQKALDDVEGEFESFVRSRYKNTDKEPSDDDLMRLMNEFNALKLVYCSDIREASPFTAGRLMATVTAAAFAYILGTFALFALALARAFLFTLKPPSGASGEAAAGKGKKAKKSRVPYLYAAAALLPFAAAAVNGAVMTVGGIMVFVLASLGLAANLLSDVLIEGRKINVKPFIRQSLSFGLAFILLFMAAAPQYGVTFQYQGESSITGREITRYATGKYNMFDYSEANDLADKKSDAYALIREIRLADVVKSLGAAIDAGVLEKPEAAGTIAPPVVSFYAEVDESGVDMTLAAAALGLAFSYLAAAALCAVLLLSAVGWSRGGDSVCEPLSWAAHIAHAGAAALLLALSIVIVATANPVYNFVGADAKAFITAAPIIGLIFSLGNLAQKLILKSRAVRRE